MTKLLFAVVLCASSGWAQLAPHPRLLLNDDRHGGTLLSMIRAKAAAGASDWTDMLAKHDLAYNNNAVLNLATSGLDVTSSYLFGYTLMDQILVAQPSRYGAAHTAAEYGAFAKAIFQSDLTRWKSRNGPNGCVNDYLSIDGDCYVDLNNASYWTNSAGNIWYTNRRFRYTASALVKAGPLEVFVHDYTSRQKMFGTGLLVDWDWSQMPGTGGVDGVGTVRIPIVKTFTGFGTDDLILSASYGYLGMDQKTFCVEVEDTSVTPNKYRYSVDGCSTWIATGRSMTTMQEGVAVRWTSNTGHTVGDRWSVPVPARTYVYSVGNPASRGQNLL